MHSNQYILYANPDVTRGIHHLRCLVILNYPMYTNHLLIELRYKISKWEYDSNVY